MSAGYSSPRPPTRRRAASPEPNATSAVPAAPLVVLQRHDLRRRRRLLRIITLGIMVPIVLMLPTVFIPSLDVNSLVALLLGLGAAIIAYFLNQYDRVSAGGFVLLSGIALAIGWDIVFKARVQGGVDLGDLRLFDLFVLPILLSGVLISRRGPVVIAAGCILFTVLSLFLLPHTPILQQYWDGRYTVVLGSVYDVIGIAVLLQALAGVGSWLGADSVRRALLDASRADDLAAANERIQAHAAAAEQRDARLRTGIAHLQQVHAAVARGQWDARAHVAEGDLLPVAMSLNLLLDRLGRLMREQDQRLRLEQGVEALTVALRRIRAGAPTQLPTYAGTPLDGVLIELAALHLPAAGAPPAGGPVPPGRESPTEGPPAFDAVPDTSAPGPNYIPPWLPRDR